MKTKAKKTTARKNKPAPRKSASRRGKPASRRAHKPKGYTSVSPYLVVGGAQRVIDFLKRAFGATDLRRYEAPDGSILHAEVRIDDTVVMLGDGGPEWPPFPSFLHVYVPDVDAAYKQALAAGGTSVQDPKQRPGDPDKRGGVKDPAGNTWWISTQMS